MSFTRFCRRSLIASLLLLHSAIAASTAAADQNLRRQLLRTDRGGAIHPAAAALASDARGRAYLKGSIILRLDPVAQAARTRALSAQAERRRDAKAVEAVIKAFRVSLNSKQRNKFTLLHRGLARVMYEKQQTTEQAGQQLAENYILKRSEKPSFDAAAVRVRAAGLQKQWDKRLVLNLAPSADPARLAKKINRSPLLRSVGVRVSAWPNYLLLSADYPNDPGMSSGQWAPGQVGANAIWNEYGIRGNPAVHIAVIDSGVDYDHPDLTSNIAINTNDAPDGLDNDNNGYTDDTGGYDFVTGPYDGCDDDCDGADDPDASDREGHGTHVAGITAALADNQVGIAGICPGCKIIPLRAGFRSADGSTRFPLDSVINALEYAVLNGADVVNMSFGAAVAEVRDALRDTLQWASDSGVILIAAAGNQGTSDEYYPAADPHVIAVASTDRSDRRNGWSSYGDWVAIGAPGDDILSLAPGGSYVAQSGTSMAAPQVAGGIGLLISSPAYIPIRPDYHDLASLRELIQETSDRIPGESFGRLNLYRAAVRLNGPPARPTATEPPEGNDPPVVETPAATATAVPTQAVPTPRPVATATRTPGPTPTNRPAATVTPRPTATPVAPTPAPGTVYRLTADTYTYGNDGTTKGFNITAAGLALPCLRAAIDESLSICRTWGDQFTGSSIQGELITRCWLQGYFLKNQVEQETNVRYPTGSFAVTPVNTQTFRFFKDGVGYLGNVTYIGELYFDQSCRQVPIPSAGMPVVEAGAIHQRGWPLGWP